MDNDQPHHQIVAAQLAAALIVKGSTSIGDIKGAVLTYYRVLGELRSSQQGKQR